MNWITDIFKSDKQKEYEQHVRIWHGEIYRSLDGEYLSCDDPNCEYVKKINEKNIV